MDSFSLALLLLAMIFYIYAFKVLRSYDPFLRFVPLIFLITFALGYSVNGLISYLDPVEEGTLSIASHQIFTGDYFILSALQSLLFAFGFIWILYLFLPVFRCAGTSCLVSNVSKNAIRIYSVIVFVFFCVLEYKIVEGAVGIRGVEVGNANLTFLLRLHNVLVPVLVTYLLVIGYEKSFRFVKIISFSIALISVFLDIVIRHSKYTFGVYIAVAVLLGIFFRIKIKPFHILVVAVILLLYPHANTVSLSDEIEPVTESKTILRTVHTFTDRFTGINSMVDLISGGCNEIIYNTRESSISNNFTKCAYGIYEGHSSAIGLLGYFYVYFEYFAVLPALIMVFLCMLTVLLVKSTQSKQMLAVAQLLVFIFWQPIFQDGLVDEYFLSLELFKRVFFLAAVWLLLQKFDRIISKNA